MDASKSTSERNLRRLVYVFRLWLRPSLFASLLFLVGVSGDLRVVVAVVCFSRLFHEPGIMEPRSFMMFLICLLAYLNVRTKPQRDVGTTEAKNVDVRFLRGK